MFRLAVPCSWKAIFASTNAALASVSATLRMDWQIYPSNAAFSPFVSIFFASSLSLSHTKYTTFIIFFDFLTNSLIRRPRSPLLSNRTPRASSSLYVSISSLSLSLSLSHFSFSLPVLQRKICAKFFINIIKRRVRSFYYDFYEL